MANNGLLDLSALESAKEDDVMNLNLNEAADVNIPVPGGLNEKAPGQPADQTIPVPATTTISADAYNAALANLKKSFKEAAEVVEMLERAKVVNVSDEDKQKEFTESAIEEAMFESYADGPMFEAVKNPNKAEIKAVAKKIRNMLCTSRRKANWRNSKGSAGDKLGWLHPFFFMTLNKQFEMRAWQVVCLLYPEKRLNMKSVVDDLHEEFAEDLKGYKLRILKTRAFLKDPERLDKEDNKRSADVKSKLYILVVDNADSKSEGTVDLEVDKSTFDKIRKMVAPEKSMNEFVEIFESGCEECDDPDCDGKECKDGKDGKKEDKKD